MVHLSKGKYTKDEYLSIVSMQIKHAMSNNMCIKLTDKSYMIYSTSKDFINLSYDKIMHHIQSNINHDAIITVTE